MIYFLDTSVLIDMLRGTVDADEFVDRHERDTLITSSLCVFEVLSGIERSHKNTLEKKRKAFQALLQTFSHIVSFTMEDASIAGNIYATLASAGQQIDDLDILIGASAIKSGATMVTGNPRHFERIKELTVKTPDSA